MKRKTENLSLDEVVEFLKPFENGSTARIYNNHEENNINDIRGIKIADLKKIEKRVKKNYQLSLELFDTGVYEYMYLAGLISEGDLMSTNDLNKWVNNSKFEMIAEYTIPFATSHHPDGYKLAKKWLDSDNELIKSSGWATISKLIATSKFDESEALVIKSLLARVEKEIHHEDNRVRYTMNSFVITVGAYYSPLSNQAKEVARRIGKVKVNMGKTACKVPDALSYIEKIEKRIALKK